MEHDIHQEIVSSWDECGKYLAKSNFLEKESKLYVEHIHGQFTSLFWINFANSWPSALQTFDWSIEQFFEVRTIFKTKYHNLIVINYSFFVTDTPQLMIKTMCFKNVSFFCIFYSIFCVVLWSIIVLLSIIF